MDITLRLKRLFDYQKFEQDAELDALIGETDAYLARELTDDEMSFVNAAGEFESFGENEPSGEEDDDT